MVINSKELNLALEEIEVNKGISRDVVIQAIIEALTKAFKKQLGGDDAKVKIVFDADKGIIELYQIKDVVEEVVDDFLEISPEDAMEIDPSKEYKVGDEFFIKSESEVRKSFALAVKSVFKQKFSDVEKATLLDTFKDKLGTMITGKIEKIDEKGANINIGRTSVFLPRSQMIGDERLLAGDNIKLFVSEVSMGSKGARIVVSRANEGFLKALFVEEIHEIYDGTIEIVNIARKAGEKSKVALISNDPSVDPSAACIGPSGTRIQKIVSQLGNSQNSKEKIDIINYSDNPMIYAMESIKPATAIGIKYDEENKSAIIIVKDDGFSTAIGKKGVNVRLATKLTGLHLDIKTETQANEDNINYLTYEEVQAEDIKRQNELLRKELDASTVLPTLPEGYVAPQERVYEEEENDFDESLLEQSEKEIAPVTEEVVEEVKETVEPTVETVQPVKEEIKKVETTTTIEDLEKSLQAEADKKHAKANKKSFKKNSKKEEEEEKSESAYATDPSKYMSIYTQEELDKMDEEEEEEYDSYDDEEIDYDDYDEYYDDDNK
ncbi:MAG: transcription termination factor NusA [Bacilli bacterium]